MIESFESISSVTDVAKIILESTSISSSTPESILKQFDTYGIEWHLTEKGDLFIKSWCIAAENFVPPEYVMELRNISESHSEANSLDWVSKHLSELTENYPGKWIAVKNGLVVADSDNVISLMKQLHDQSIESPFITKIPIQPVVWETTYVYKRV
ncbi:MAG TPA: DUF5678 domain-containing protein [Syntrophales bacterium]|nr:DUF5678 domain-containing protein [Syntrophales bacterium]HQN78003.1 DUF5678 domain-containing protein [Syntrophales bacterium]HQQ26825.1 DUF5678 domain-containing protein [Syntrophales bacterium]